MKQKETKKLEKIEQEKPKDLPTIEEVILKPRRVSTKRKGGSSFHFSVLSAAGNRAGKVGVAIAKSKDMSSAVKKSMAKARASMVDINLTEDGSIPHEVFIKNGASKLYLKPAPLGTGIIAGGSVRQVLELAGVKNISAKIIGTNNQISNSYTLMKALTELKQDAKFKEVSENKDKE